MANSWFRMYGEFATDPKVQMLSEVYQRRLTMLFCLRCNGCVTLHDSEVTFMLRISDIEWAETKTVFMLKGFINYDNEILNWDKRQYVSDSSAERVAKHRANKKIDVTLSNVTVTPPEQNRTDTEQIQNISDTEHKNTKKGDDKNLPIPNFVDFELWSAFIEVRKELKAKNTLRAINALINQLQKLKDDGNDPNEVVSASIRASWKDLYPLKKQSNVLTGYKTKFQQIQENNRKAGEEFLQDFKLDTQEKEVTND